jgi:SAM-dependent MidA family methyltransferase
MTTIQKLPEPSDIAKRHSLQLQQLICEEIDKKGPMPFEQYMAKALYTSGLGYYSAGATKFGSSGDFTTAPEISPLYGRALAKQYQQIAKEINHTKNKSCILELGAGTGALALSILQELDHTNSLPEHYYILEVSADCKLRQQEHLQKNIPKIYHLVSWLDSLPATPIDGMIIANEVLDAMPVCKFQTTNEGIFEYYVTHNKQQLEWSLQPSHNKKLINKVDQLDLPKDIDYCSEINFAIPGWVAGLNAALRHGVILLIDYGFPEKAYYHPQRSMGTLMCHYKHQAHDNPLIYCGIQDITAHVDFTAIAEAAADCELTIEGYTHQSAFLTSCGIHQCMQASTPLQQARERQQVHLLTHPSEMGESFKVIALSRDLDSQMIGFSLLNLLEKL